MINTNLVNFEDTFFLENIIYNELKARDYEVFTGKTYKGGMDFVVINGRKKNLIVLDNGKNVYPEEIENYILGIPYVQEVVVKGKKNKIGQEVALIAEVFLNEEKVKELEINNVEAKLKEDIQNVCKELPMYKRISDIEIRKEEFEKTTTNKIKR